jgi:hypothetical protein
MMQDPRMGLGFDQLEWLPDELEGLSESLPWLEWTPLPEVPGQRVAMDVPLVMPSGEAARSMGPWARSLQLPGWEG